MSPQEFIRRWKEAGKPPLFPKPLPISRIIKDELVWESKHAEQPWSSEEVKEVMRALGLKPGYD